MKSSVRLAVLTIISLALTLSVSAPKARAQYMFLDANGDGAWTTDDKLNPDTTTVRLWLDINHDKNLSVRTCNDHTVASVGNVGVLTSTTAGSTTLQSSDPTRFNGGLGAPVINVGVNVVGGGFATGTTVTANVSGSQLTVSGTGPTASGSFNITYNKPIVCQATVGSPNLTSAGLFGPVSVGMTISAGFPAGTTVIAVNSTSSVTMSANATAGTNVSRTFSAGAIRSDVIAGSTTITAGLFAQIFPGMTVAGTGAGAPASGAASPFIVLTKANESQLTLSIPATVAGTNTLSYYNGLDIAGFDAIVSVTGGDVDFGTAFVPAPGFSNSGQPELAGPSGEATAHQLNNNYLYSQNGRFLLGYWLVTVLTGNPRIDIVDISTLDPSSFFTGFSSHCDASTHPYTYTHGIDWFDVDGVAEPIVGNSQPAITAPATASAVEDAPLELIDATASDADVSDILTITQSGMPADLTFTHTPGVSPVTASITGTPGFDDAGTYAIVWTVGDGVGGAASDTTTLTITNTDRPPSITSPSSAAGSASAPIVFNAGASDPDGQETSFQISNLPVGAEFVRVGPSALGEFYWTPDPSQAGNFNVVFTASNEGGTTTATTNITVTPPDGPRRARVSAGLIALQLGHLDEKILERDDSDRPFINMFITGDASNNDLNARGVAVGSRAGRRMTASCPLDSLSSVFQMPGLDAIVESGFCRLLLDSSTVDSHVDGLRAYRPTPSDFKGATGTGVVVGIVDTGVDFTSPDFRDVNGNTRIVSFWDQTRMDIFNPPTWAGFTYGTEWSPTSINSYNLGVNNGVPGQLRNAKDLLGHGTHTAGIAAGNGLGGAEGACLERYRFIGLAPQADLCVVKVRTTGLEFGVFETKVVDAVNYIFQKAGPGSGGLNKPAVVNLSLGSHTGPHDGRSSFDWWINHFMEKTNPSAPAKIVVAAAGNNNAPPAIHASVLVKADATSVITMDIPPYTPGLGANDEVLYLHGFFYLPDTFSVRVISPQPGDGSNGHAISVGPVSHDYTAQEGNDVDGHILVCQSHWDGCTSASESFAWLGYEGDIFIRLTNAGGKPPAYGTWQIEITGNVIGNGLVDLYIEHQRGGAIADTTSFGNTPIGFVEGADFGRVVLSPATADSVIAVGAYTTKKCWISQDSGQSPCAPGTYGDIAPFSSHGPRRDGVIKPDLTAPGQMIVSTLSDTVRTTHAIDSLYWVGHNHAALGGTSQAAPHVTGAVALLLSDPNWRNAYPSQVKARLQGTARRDGFTGEFPDSIWGSGKLDVGAALAPVYSLHLQNPKKGVVWHSTGLISVSPSLHKADSVQVFLSRSGCPYDANAIRITRLDNIPAGGIGSFLFTVPDSLRTTRGLIHAISYARSDSPPNQYIVEAFADVVIDTTRPVAVEETAPARRFALSQNVPNPFNPSTTITLEIARPGPVTLRIFSVDGRLVRTLVNKPLGPGLYPVRWNATDDRGAAVGSGVYFYRAVSDGKRIGRKMVVLK